MNNTETQPIDNSADVIDSRHVIARIEYLGEQDSTELDEDEISELAALLALQAEASDYAADWEYGEALIRASYFEDYARELADDIGAIPANIGWPCTCIDWERAARELAMDYTMVTFGGVDYYIR